MKPEGQTKDSPLYTYNDWWTGKVHLLWSPCAFEKDEPAVPGVDWDRFLKADVPKIRNKQRLLYKSQVNELTSEWKKDFSKRYKQSELKHILLQRELQTFYDAMFRPYPDQELVHVGPKRLLFRSHDLGNIQRWIESIIINGDDINYHGVHSPNCRFKDWRKKPDDIYANSCWIYYKWLQTFLPKKTRNEKAKETGSDKDDARFNSYIFKNRSAELLFDDYCKSYNAEMKKTWMALLSFIYWKMKSDQLLNDITPTQFRHFLSALPANYVLDKLKTYDKCKSADKIKVYEICKAKLFS